MQGTSAASVTRSSGLMMRRLLLFVGLVMAVSLPAEAIVTISWSCNPEPDMLEYRLERASGSGPWGVIKTVPHPKPCTSPVTTQDTGYLAPGVKSYRLFAIDTTKNSSPPSNTASITIPVPPISSPGGMEEAALPPSPWVAQTPPPPVITPPPPVVTPPPPVVTPPPPVVTPPPPPKPGDLTNLSTVDIVPTGATILFVTPTEAKANIRLMKAPFSWGAAASLTCGPSSCVVTGLTPNTQYQWQGIPYVGTMNQGATYGNFSPVMSFKTPAAPVTPPPVVPPPVTPPPPTSDTEARLKALEDKLGDMETMGAVLDAELQEIRATLKAMCQALKGHCP